MKMPIGNLPAVVVEFAQRVLIPAAEKARELGAKDPDAETLQALFDAAHAGALDTEELAAKKGRASYLGDRSKGIIDPGTIVVSWLFGGEPLSAH